MHLHATYGAVAHVAEPSRTWAARQRTTVHHLADNAEDLFLIVGSVGLCMIAMCRSPMTCCESGRFNATPDMPGIVLCDMPGCVWKAIQLAPRQFTWQDAQQLHGMGFVWHARGLCALTGAAVSFMALRELVLNVQFFVAHTILRGFARFNWIFTCS